MSNQVYPESMEMRAMAPAGQTMSDGIDLTAILAGVERVHINQKADILEGFISCCNRANVYTGYSGPFKNLPEGVAPAPAIFVAKEESSCMERVCCCGKHGMVIRFHEAVPDPNSKSGWSAGPTVYNTLERKGACNGKPLLGCWNVSCCPCHEMCLEEMNMYKGNQTIEAPNPAAMMFQSKQPNCCAAPCKFEFGIFTPNAPEPSMTVVGPCFFGGWKSMLCGDDFRITDKTGDVGKLEKRAPESCGDCLREICTDADDYSVQFQPQPGMTVTPEQKLAMTTAAFMADFMVFEKDPGPCHYDCDEKALVCVLCNCMLCQRICMCKMLIGLDGSISCGC